MLIPSNLQTMLDIKPTPISPHQYFGFSWKSYVSYSQKAQIVYKKTHNFYPVSEVAMKALLLKAVIVQVLFVLLLKATDRAMPCW